MPLISKTIGFYTDIIITPIIIFSLETFSSFFIRERFLFVMIQNVKMKITQSAINSLFAFFDAGRVVPVPVDGVLITQHRRRRSSSSGPPPLRRRSQRRRPVRSHQKITRYRTGNSFLVTVGAWQAAFSDIFVPVLHCSVPVPLHIRSMITVVARKKVKKTINSTYTGTVISKPKPPKGTPYCSCPSDEKISEQEQNPPLNKKSPAQFSPGSKKKN